MLLQAIVEKEAFIVDDDVRDVLLAVTVECRRHVVHQDGFFVRVENRRRAERAADIAAALGIEISDRGRNTPESARAEHRRVAHAV